MRMPVPDQGRPGGNVIDTETESRADEDGSSAYGTLPTVAVQRETAARPAEALRCRSRDGVTLAPAACSADGRARCVDALLEALAHLER